MDGIKTKFIGQTGSGGTSNKQFHVKILSVEDAQRFIDDETYRNSLVSWAVENAPPKTDFIFISRFKCSTDLMILSPRGEIEHDYRLWNEDQRDKKLRVPSQETFRGVHDAVNMLCIWYSHCMTCDFTRKKRTSFTVHDTWYDWKYRNKSRPRQ